MCFDQLMNGYVKKTRICDPVDPPEGAFARGPTGSQIRVFKHIHTYVGQTHDFFPWCYRYRNVYDHMNEITIYLEKKMWF